MPTWTCSGCVLSVLRLPLLLLTVARAPGGCICTLSVQRTCGAAAQEDFGLEGVIAARGDRFLPEVRQELDRGVWAGGRVLLRARDAVSMMELSVVACL